MINLNLGCGDVYFDGWVNIDLDSAKADMRLDLREALPFEDNTVDYIYNEHFIEHVTVEEAVKLLMECFRVLREGGVMRIATPDLDYIVFRHWFFWKKQNWIKKHGYEWVQTNAELMNINFREWGHQYLYNYRELKRRLTDAGFNSIKKVSRNRSKFEALRGLETRDESRLVLEAIK